MNINLLIFFALPIAIIVISIALQKLLKNALLVSFIIFSIFLIVAVVLNNINVFALAVAYALLSYITAVISCLACKYLSNNSTEVTAQATIIPNSNTNGRTGTIRGCYRRR